MNVSINCMQQWLVYKQFLPSPVLRFATSPWPWLWLHVLGFLGFDSTGLGDVVLIAIFPYTCAFNARQRAGLVPLEFCNSNRRKN